MARANILIIDDEPAICSSLTFALEDQYSVEAVTEPRWGLSRLKEKNFDIILLDLKLGEVSGIEVLQEIKKISSHPVVIVMTAYGTIPSSVEAMRKGAFFYLTKPLNMEELITVIDKAISFNKMSKQVEYLSNELKKKHSTNEIIGTSPAMKEVFTLIDKVKDIDSNVLITGESGTGKELVVRAIHYSSKRKKEPFEAINCAALPENLLESELFGYEKGAFTGAERRNEGKFILAAEGTIFLDEIGEMPLHLQAKLLRVIQQKEVVPLGSTKKYQLKCRIIAATNIDLQQAAARGDFRQDLFFRLNVIPIVLPALRERRQDLPQMIAVFINKFNNEMGKKIKGMAPEAEELLTKYNFPGNVRELSNIIERAVALSNSEYLSVQDLPKEIQNEFTLPIDNNTATESLVGLPLKEIERKMIFATLKKTGGHRKKAAELLGISERGLRLKLKEYNS